MDFLYDHREVGRVHFLELSAGKLENIWMHMWRYWTAKICKVNRYAVIICIKYMVPLIVDILTYFTF